MKHLISAMVLFCVSTSLLAQNTQTLSSSEAVKLGLDKSKKIKITEQQIQETSSKVEQAKESRIPTVSVSGAYMYINQPNVDVKTTPQIDPNNPPVNPLGGIDFSKVNTVMFGQVQVTQPLFTGFKIRNSIASAQYLKEASEYQLAATKDEVALSIYAAIYQYYSLQESSKLVKENLKQAEQRVRDLTNLEQSGVITRNDLLKAELQQSNLELALSDVENKVKIANYNLCILLGLPENITIELNTSDIFELNQLASLDDFMGSALTERNDLKAATTRIKASELMLSATKSDRYPQIALTGAYINANIPNFVAITNVVNVGVGVKYNITGAVYNRNKMIKSRAKLEQSQLYEESVKDQIKTDVNQAYLNYLQSLKKIEISKKAIEQAKENYRISKDKYDNQLVLLSDLLEAEVTQLQTEINLANAKAEAMLAHYQLQKVSGKLTY